MIRAIRYTGFCLVIVGVLLLVSWAFEPLRNVWPIVLSLPLPVRIGAAIAVLGLTILFGSLLAERFNDRESDTALRDDDYGP